MSRGSALYEALSAKAHAELLNESATDRQLRFMVRIKKGPNTTMWLSIVDRLLEIGDSLMSAGTPPWTIDVSKQYFRRQGELKFGWRIIFQGAELYDHLPSLAREVRAVVVQPTILEVQEIPLHGSPNRSKTAGYMGQVPVGPSAVR